MHPDIDLNTVDWDTMPDQAGHFGIKDAETAAAVAKTSDTAIVGSVLVKMIEENPDNDDLIIANTSELLAEMRQAMDKIL